MGFGGRCQHIKNKLKRFAINKIVRWEIQFSRGGFIPSRVYRNAIFVTV
jgi:hypothetical protein